MNGTTHSHQSSYGHRLLPCILDSEAKHHPNRTFATIARANDTFQDISFLQVANAVNHVAQQLRAHFGVIPAFAFETITFLGVPDLRYNIVFYAAVKCGYKVLLPSPRNALATNVSLMEQTRSSKVAYVQEVEALFKALGASKAELSSLLIGTLDELLSTERASVVPYQPTFDEAVDDPIVVVHSSGSTGLPKPVVMTHGTFAVMDNDRNFPTVPGRKNHDLTLFDFDGAGSNRIYEPFPPFHVGGFFYKIVLPLYTRTIPVFGPTLRPPSGGVVADILKQQQIRGCILPPAVAEQLLHEPHGLDCFKQLDVFCYAGGPLSQATGDTISSVTSVCQFYGSTEMGQVRQLVPQGEDWPYMEFHPSAKLELRPSDDDAYEMIIFADKDTRGYCALNHNFPDVKEWQTKDLFKRHPTKKHLWRFHGRKDDIIVLSSGEKLYPVPMENQLQGLPNISGALVTGHERFQPALLLEIKPAEGRNDVAILDELWPAIESANKNMPGHGRVTRQMILLARNDKPFIRAGKGTIVRKLTEKAYAEEIEDLYASRTQHRAPILVATALTLDAIENLIRSILPPSIGSCKAGDDLYISGLDSLKTVEAVEILRSSLSHHRPTLDLRWLSADTFYSNPSIAQLSHLVLDFLDNDKVPRRRDRIATMSEMLESFATPLEPLPQPPQVFERVSSRVTIAITGTTGTLGPYLLEDFLHSPMISEIYCLNRSSTAKEHWQDHCESRNFNAKASTAKLSFVTIRFGSEDLGIRSSDELEAIRHCDLIVHNAWKVDFKQDLASFAEDVQSVQTLANWSASSPRHPRVVFLSSVSSVGQCNPSDDESGIPEASIENLDASLPIGYAESKRVAERLLDRAAADCGAQVSILRIGQIGGPATATRHSRWSAREAIPAMLKTAKSLNLIPSDFPPVDWIPVDVVSKIVAELSLNDVRNSSIATPRYYNVVNPQRVPWRDFIPSMKQYCGPEAQAAPLVEWIRKLKTFDTNDATELASRPALKMLDFYAMTAASSDLATRYQTQAAVEASKTMAGLEPVSTKLMATWLDQCG